MMRRAGLLAAMLLIAGPARGQFSVFDASAVAQLVKQLETLRAQLEQQRATYNALTGARGLGDILNNPQLRQYLPADWMLVYDTARSGGYSGISGTVAAITAAEKLRGSIAEQQVQVKERETRTAAVDKAVGLQGFAGARARLDQLDALSRKINETKDQKSIQELQARLAVEQAAIANEQTKLQLIDMLQRSEERLAEEQRKALNDRIMDPRNTGMPQVR